MAVISCAQEVSPSILYFRTFVSQTSQIQNLSNVQSAKVGYLPVVTHLSSFHSKIIHPLVVDPFSISIFVPF